MKLVRVLSRLIALLVAVGAFVGLTAMYYEHTPHVALPATTVREMGARNFERWQAEIRHQPSAPELGYFSEFVASAIMLAIFGWMGRLLFRLRLNPAPRGEGQLIFCTEHSRRAPSL